MAEQIATTRKSPVAGWIGAAKGLVERSIPARVGRARDGRILAVGGLLRVGMSIRRFAGVIAVVAKLVFFSSDIRLHRRAILRSVHSCSSATIGSGRNLVRRTSRLCRSAGRRGVRCKGSARALRSLLPIRRTKLIDVAIVGRVFFFFRSLRRPRIFFVLLVLVLTSLTGYRTMSISGCFGVLLEERITARRGFGRDRSKRRRLGRRRLGRREPEWARRTCLRIGLYITSLNGNRFVIAASRGTNAGLTG